MHGPGAQNTCCGEQCFSFCVNFCHVFSSGLSFGKQKRPSKFTRWKRTCGKIVSEKVKISFKCGLGTVRQYHFIVSGYFPLSQKFWTFKTGENGTWNVLLCVQKKSKTLLIFQNANHSPFWEENQMEQKCYHNLLDFFLAVFACWLKTYSTLLCAIFYFLTGIWLPFKIEKSVAILFLVKKKIISVSSDAKNKFFVSSVPSCGWFWSLIKIN